jgi:hypothetical protein
MTKCDINDFLKRELHVYIRPPKKVVKGEVQTLLKRPSFVDAEAGKVISHLEDLMILLNQGQPITAKQQLELSAADKFMSVYNLARAPLQDA